MAQNQGTLVIASIRPNNSLDTYPVAICNEIKGGHHTYLTLNELYSIPVLRRQAGMFATVTNNPQSSFNNIYVLQEDLITWAYLDDRYIISADLEDVNTNHILKLLIRSPYQFKVDKLYIEADVGSCTVDTIINIENNAIGITPTPIAELIPLVRVASNEQWVMQGDPITYTFRARYLQSDIDLAISQGKTPVFRSTPLPIQVRFNALNYFIPSRSAYPTEATINQTLYIPTSGELTITRTAQGDTFSNSIEDIELYPLPAFISGYEEAVILNNIEGVYKIGNIEYMANVPIYRSPPGVIQQLYKYITYVYKDIVRSLIYLRPDTQEYYSYTEATDNGGISSVSNYNDRPILFGAVVARDYWRVNDPTIRYQQFAARMYTPIYTVETPNANLLSQSSLLSAEMSIYDSSTGRFITPNQMQSPNIDLAAYRYLTGLTTSPAGNPCPLGYVPPFPLVTSYYLNEIVGITDFPAPYTVYDSGTYWVHFIVEPGYAVPQRNWIFGAAPSYSFTREFSGRVVIIPTTTDTPNTPNLSPPWLETAGEIDLVDPTPTLTLAGFSVSSDGTKLNYTVTGATLTELSGSLTTSSGNRSLTFVSSTQANISGAAITTDETDLTVSINSSTPYLTTIVNGLSVTNNSSVAPTFTNNHFANRITILGTNVNLTADNSQANLETGEDSGNFNYQASLWWEWTPTVSGSTTINTLGSNFDTVLAVYTGSVLASLVRVVINDDFGGSGVDRYASSVTFTAVANTSYSIAVLGYSTNRGSINLTLNQTV